MAVSIGDVTKGGMKAAVDDIMRILEAKADQKTIRAAFAALGRIGSVGPTHFMHCHFSGDTVTNVGDAAQAAGETGAAVRSAPSAWTNLYGARPVSPHMQSRDWGIGGASPRFGAEEPEATPDAAGEAAGDGDQGDPHLADQIGDVTP